MGDNPGAAKRPFNLNMNSDWVEQCKVGIDNFSAYAESLLATDLEQSELRAAAEKAVNEQAIDGFAALHQSERSLSEEFQYL